MRIGVVVLALVVTLGGCGSSGSDASAKVDPGGIAGEVAGESGLRPVGPQPGNEGFCGETHKAFAAYNSMVAAANSDDFPARVAALVATSRSAESAAPAGLSAASKLVFDVARAHAEMAGHMVGTVVDEKARAAFVAVADDPAFDDSVTRLAAAIDEQCPSPDYVVEDALDALQAEVSFTLGSDRSDHPSTS